MNSQTKTTTTTPSKSKASLVYGKFSAFLGVAAGLALVFGTPVIVTFFHDENSEWVESLPEWTVPIMLFIGMGGGVLVILLSALFGMLIPSRVIPTDEKTN